MNTKRNIFFSLGLVVVSWIMQPQYVNAQIAGSPESVSSNSGRVGYLECIRVVNNSMRNQTTNTAYCPASYVGVSCHLYARDQNALDWGRTQTLFRDTWFYGETFGLFTYSITSPGVWKNNRTACDVSLNDGGVFVNGERPYIHLECCRVVIS